MPDLRDQLQSTLGSVYTIERELGGGGMSRVFVAEEIALHRRVVVKVLPHEMAASVSMERFKREIMLAARLQHPHIVPLLSAGDTDGLPYLTMPFVDGESLRGRLVRGGELPVAEGLRILREVASALAYAHEQGIVHRDIKPDNVLLSRGRSAMVTDFGVAKALSASSNTEHGGVTSLGVALGTPAYMSPEQAAASPEIDARADIYAFGVMAYELFAGRPPFSGRSPQALLAAHVSEPPESVQALRPSLPPALATLIMRCLEKRAADRPQRADEIVSFLDAITTPGAGSTPTVGLSPTKWTTRRVVLVVTGAVVVAAGAIVGTRSLRANRGGGGGVMVAVLPFENQGPAADDYFGDGLAEEITNQLANVPALGVIAQRSASQYKRSTKSLSEIGRELGVQYVLQGTVRWLTDSIGGRSAQIRPSLVRVSDGTVRWAAEPYVVRPTDVFAVQTEIATRVTSALDVALAVAPSATASRRPTRSAAAYDAYLRGVDYQQRFFGTFDPSLNKLAADEFTKAIHLDTTFALAQAKLAIGQAFDLSYVLGDSTRSREITTSVRRALELDPNLADAHLARALQLENVDTDIPAATRELQRALELRPGDAFVMGLLGDAEGDLGDTTGLPWLAKSVALDPRNAASINLAVSNFYQFRRFAAADQYAKRWESLGTDAPDALAWQAMIALSARGDTAEVERLLAASAHQATRVTSTMLAADIQVRSGIQRIVQTQRSALFASTPYDSEIYFIAKGLTASRVHQADARRAYGDSLIALVRNARIGGGIIGIQNGHGTLAIGLWLAGDREGFRREAEQTMTLLRSYGERNTVLATWSCYLASTSAADGDVERAVRYERMCLSLPSGSTSWNLRRDPSWSETLDRPEVQALLREFSPPVTR